MAQYEITSEPAAVDFECESSWVARTLQNAKNLLMCRRGEVPFDRQRGLDPMIFDLPIPDAEEILLPELDRVMLWEPDVEVVGGELEITDDGETLIRCVVRIDEAQG